MVDVAEQVVDAWDPHRPGLCVQPRRELPERVDPSADAVLGLEDQRLVARPCQLVARDEAGHAGADDDHLLAGRVPAQAAASDSSPPLEPVLERRQRGYLPERWSIRRER